MANARSCLNRRRSRNKGRTISQSAPPALAGPIGRPKKQPECGFCRRYTNAQKDMPFWRWTLFNAIDTPTEMATRRSISRNHKGIGERTTIATMIIRMRGIVTASCSRTLFISLTTTATLVAWPATTMPQRTTTTPRSRGSRTSPAKCAIPKAKA